MTWSDIKNKTAPELWRELAGLQAQLQTTRFRVGQGQLKDVRQVRQLKRDIAQHLTKLKQLSLIRPNP